MLAEIVAIVVLGEVARESLRGNRLKESSQLVAASVSETVADKAVGDCR